MHHFVFYLLFSVALILLVVLSPKVATFKIRLHWEYPANRRANSAMVVELTVVKPARQSSVYTLQSPSMVSYIQDPYQVEARIIHATNTLYTNKQKIIIRLPRAELQGASVGEQIGLSLIDSSLCIGVTTFKDKNIDLQKWIGLHQN